jgi:cytochrome oxidase Cu insertion factor (SCO1/SenC/PrrC family)
VIALFSLLACHPASPPAAEAVANLNGLRPSAPLEVPDFSAINQDGVARSKADLLGHPTAVWFFPAAGTPG